MKPRYIGIIAVSIICFILISISGILLYIAIDKSEERIIQGRILEKGTYTALSNCTVSLDYVDNIGWYDDVIESIQTITNEDGEFTFHNIKTPSDFKEDVNKIRIRAWDDFHFLNKIRIDFDDSYESIKIELTPGGKIFGELLHEEGEDSQLYLCAYKGMNKDQMFPIRIENNRYYESNLLTRGYYTLFLCSDTFVPTDPISTEVLECKKTRLDIEINPQTSSNKLHFNITMIKINDPLIRIFSNDEPILCFPVLNENMTICLPSVGNYTIETDLDHELIMGDEEIYSIEIYLKEGDNYIDFDLYYVVPP